MSSHTCLICGAPTQRDGSTGRHPSYCSVACRRRMETRRKSMEKEHAKLTASVLQLERQIAGPMAEIVDGETLLLPKDLLPILRKQLDEIEQVIADSLGPTK